MNIQREPPATLPPPMRRDGKINFLPPAQQIMKEQERQVLELEKNLTLERLNYEMLNEANNKMRLGLDAKVAASRRLLEEREDTMRRQQYEVDRAKQLSQKFKVSIAMPFIRPEPPGFSRRDDFSSPETFGLARSRFNRALNTPTHSMTCGSESYNLLEGNFFRSTILCEY
jgi:hypothetical protein